VIYSPTQTDSLNGMPARHPQSIIL